MIGLVTPATLYITKTLPYLDDTWLDPRTSAWDVYYMLELRAELRSATIVRVYDFEQSPTS
ncbi:MAG: hypothetical protein CK529_01910 [Rhodospirillaceae bacterium]|nr:MAG: hypothetical protein CK529_01910 [Rhodospirillaceae bacterium]